MTIEGRGFHILLAEDDEDDSLLIRDAVAEAGIAGTVHIVGDGQAMLDYLRRSQKTGGDAACPRPDLVILDLHMPRKTGVEALAELRADREICHFPVVVLTTSRQPKDMADCYDQGITSFIVKPDSYRALVDIVRNLASYWLGIG
jgi:CheY-like chemotaxis protein